MNCGFVFGWPCGFKGKGVTVLTVHSFGTLGMQ